MEVLVAAAVSPCRSDSSSIRESQKSDGAIAGLPGSAEQLTHLFAVACGDPALSDRPISHCTARVEIWFSILVRKLLKRASFLSTNDLKEKLPAFIDYFNRTMAKPFKWTCKGKALSA